MCPFLQEPDNTVAPEELLFFFPYFFLMTVVAEHSHSGDPGKVTVQHYKAYRAEMNSSALWKH